MLRLTTFLLASVLVASSCAQQQGTAQSAPDITPSTPMARPGPPPAGATASELEITGDQLRAHNLMADAVDYYGAALKKGGDGAVLHNKIGIAQLNSMQLERARREFEQSIKVKGDYADAYNNLGATWYSKALPRNPHGTVNERDIRRAIQYYERAINLNDDSASFHSNLGTAYFVRKEYDKANVEYQRALELDPEVFERRSKVGSQLLVMTQEDRARFNYYLARLYAHQGNFDLALKCLRKAMEDGYKKIDDVYSDANFASLRKDPRFTELMTARPTAIPQ